VIVRELGSVCDVTTGQSAPQSEDAFSTTGIPFIRAGSLEPLLAGKAESSLELIDDLSAKKHKLKLFPKDTILFAKSGMSAKLARVYRIKSPCYVVSHLAAILPSEDVDPGYLHRWFEANPPSNLIANDAYPSIKTSEISKVKIPLPPLPEQKRIAAILDKADAIRRKRQQAIQLADDFLRAVFLDMFGDPVTNPKGWDLLPFSAVGTLDRGKSRHRPRNDPALLGGIHPLIQTGEVANSRGYIKEHSATYSDLGLAQSKKWDAGTLCITIAANIAKTGILTFPACFPDSVVGFIPNKHVTVEYVQHWLGFLQKNLEENAPQAAQKNINLEILRALLIPVPPKSEQEKFSSMVAGILTIEEKIASSSDALGNAFDALSQKAFSGQL